MVTNSSLRADVKLVTYFWRRSDQLAISEINLQRKNYSVGLPATYNRAGGTFALQLELTPVMK